MRGHLRQRGRDGIYYAVLHTAEKNPTTGKDVIIQRSLGTTLKHEAEIELAKLIAKHSASSFANASGTVPLGAWLEVWLQEECVPNLAVNTVKQYSSLIKNHIVPAIGLIPLTKLKTHSLQAFINKLSKTPRKDGKPGVLSPTTIGLVHAVLGSSLNRAVEFNLIPASPMKNVRPPRKDSREITPMEPDEALKFVLTAQEFSPYYALYWVCLSCGLRIGEALALRWSDIDLDARVISVRYTLLRGKGSLKERLSQPKTKKSVRTVPLSPAPLEALRQHRKRQLQARLQAGPFWADNDLAFPTSKGTPINDSNIRNRDLKRVLTKAGLGHYRLHDFRHTSATMALLAGVLRIPLKPVSGSA